MNTYLIDKIRNRSTTGDHYTEQYKYLHPSTDIKILHFENLNNEFNQLMKLHGINGIKLEHINNGLKKYTTSDFSNDLIQLINTVYNNDFIAFNYKKRHSIIKSYR
jgi:hypothetical protein